MNFFKKIISYLKKEDKKGLTSKDLFEDNKKSSEYSFCGECPLKDKECSGKIISTLRKYKLPHSTNNCMFDIELENFDKNKDTFFIIDDNEGMVSFLEDDVDYLDSKGVINKKDINILSLSGNHSAFIFEIMQDREKGLNIKWAIIDITLGGSIMTNKGNIKYTGVDVLVMILKYNPDVKFLFYTGNNLNPYIKRNKQLIDQFKEIAGEDINNYVLFKTSMDMSSRRSYIAKKLFGIDVEGS